jgi:uncharacterized alpha-E superfamily protein
MISRVADHCFWLGRYLERAESIARVLYVTRNLALDAELTPRQLWQPVIIVAGESAPFEQRFGQDACADGEAVQRYMMWDEQNPCSILRSVAAARENARSIREVISLEIWEALNELYLWLQSPECQDEYADNRHAVYRRVRQTMQLVPGLAESTMLHDERLDFIHLGLLLERTNQTARILDVHHHALSQLDTHRVVQLALWLALLRACSGFEPFMKRYQGRVTREEVAAFLVREPAFPRSVLFSLRGALSALMVIRPPAEQDLPGGATLARLARLEQLVSRAPSTPDHDSLHHLLTHVVDETAAICTLLGTELLGYAPPSTSQSQAQ